jgi:cell division protein FtsW
MIGGAIVLVLLMFAIASATGYGRAETWKKRIESFTSGEAHEVPYQVQQANIAIAGGGTVGKGPGNSTARNFLPHPYSDFIFAIILEEYGIFGAFLVLVAYLVLLLRSIRIFKNCPYAFGAFLALGLSVTLVIQALMHMAVNVHLLPVTGLTLPLVSMGGSSVIFTSLAIGIILSVSRNVEEIGNKEVTNVAVAA